MYGTCTVHVAVQNTVGTIFIEVLLRVLLVYNLDLVYVYNTIYMVTLHVSWLVHVFACVSKSVELKCGHVNIDILRNDCMYACNMYTFYSICTVCFISM